MAPPKVFHNILVTVGTTRFDRLIESLLEPQTVSALFELECRCLTIQYGGFSDPDTLNIFKSIPNIRVELFAYMKSLQSYIEQADLVIAHAGAGTSLEVLRKNKPLLIVVNNELMDNHQQELATQLIENRFAESTTPENLTKALRAFDQTKLKPFPEQNSQAFVNFLSGLLVD